MILRPTVGTALPCDWKIYENLLVQDDSTTLSPWRTQFLRVCCEFLMIASSIKMLCKYFLFDCVDACVRMCADIAGNWRNWIKSPLAWAKASGT